MSWGAAKTKQLPQQAVAEVGQDSMVLRIDKAVVAVCSQIIVWEAPEVRSTAHSVTKESVIILKRAIDADVLHVMVKSQLIVLYWMKGTTRIEICKAWSKRWPRP